MKHAHSRKAELLFRWAEPPLRVVLVEPQIPPNTGNIARLCAATGTCLHLIEPMGFKINNAKLKRAGLDYWESVVMAVHRNFQAYLDADQPARFFLFSTKGRIPLFDVRFKAGDALVFGSETHGLSDALLEAHPDRVVGIPVRTDHVRSLNLSSSVAVAVYEALRQIQL
jgi:tRNA (cytidine/uridine-2'-O-)-methyltransferase